MKKRLIKLASLMLSFFVAFSLIIIPATDDIDAEMMGTSVKYAKKMTVTISAYKPASDSDLDFLFYVDMGKKANNAQKITITSKNKSVIKPYYGDMFVALKSGTADVTIKVKKNNGKVDKYNAQIKVNKLNYPFKSIKVGKKNLTKSLKKSNETRVKLTGKKARLAIKLSKGWKINQISYRGEYLGDGAGKDFNKKLRNKASFALKNPKEYSCSLIVTFKHKKTGIIQYVEIMLK